jgi:hypothetical protein
MEINHLEVLTDRNMGSKQIFKRYAGVDWIQLDLDRGPWRVPVTTVMNLLRANAV